MKTLTRIASILSLGLFIFFTSCQIGLSNKSKDKALISIQVHGLDNVSRAATGTEAYIDTIDYENLTYRLVITSSTTRDSQTKIYESLSKVLAASIYLEYDTYDFLLEAYVSYEEALDPENSKTVYTSKKESFEVNTSSSTLEFNMEYGTATGSIEYTVTYLTGDSVTLSVGLGSIDSSNYVTSIEDSLVLSDFTEEDGICTSVYSATDLPAGTYIVFFNLIYTTEQNTTETCDVDMSVPVIPTVTTRKYFEFSDFNAIYKIDYDLESLVNIEQDLPTEFIKYHRVELPDLSDYSETLHKGFLGWSYTEGDSDPVDLTKVTKDGEVIYILNYDYSLASDVTLTANWEVWGQSELTVVDINDFALSADNTVYDLDDGQDGNCNFSVSGNVTGFTGVTYTWILNGVTLKNQISKNLSINTAKTSNIFVGENSLTVIVSGGGLSASKSIKFTVVDPIVYESAAPLPEYLNIYNDYDYEYCCDSSGNYYFAYTSSSVLTCVKPVLNTDGTLKLEDGFPVETEIASIKISSFYPVRMACDDSYVYIIGKPYSDRNYSYSGYTIYYVSTDAEGVEFKTVAIETNPFKVITAITFDSGKAYVAGDTTGSSDSDGNHNYSVYSFDIISNDNNVTFSNGKKLISYSDEEYFDYSTRGTTNKRVEDYFIPATYKQYNINNTGVEQGDVYIATNITDLGVLKGRIYALSTTIATLTVWYSTSETSKSGNSFATVESRVLSKAFSDTSDATTFSKIDLISNPTYRKYYTGNSHEAYGSFYANEEYNDTGDGNQWLIAPLRFVAIKPKKITMANAASKSDCIDLDLNSKSVSVRIGEGSYKLETITNSSSGISTGGPIDFHKLNGSSVYFDYYPVSTGSSGDITIE